MKHNKEKKRPGLRNGGIEGVLYPVYDIYSYACCEESALVQKFMTDVLLMKCTIKNLNL